MSPYFRRKTYLFFSLFLGLVLLPALLWSVDGAVASLLSTQATTITVNTTDDELNGDGDCSLREAIQAANSDAVVDACRAGSGQDTITLSAGTYTLSIAGTGEDANATGDLDILESLTINGAGSALTTIDGNDLDRIFDIDPVQAGVAFYLNDISLSDGKVSTHGGCLRALYGLAAISQSTFSSCETTTGDGGAIYTNYGTVELFTSTLENNSAFENGGGIHTQYGPLRVYSSTLQHNTSGNDGGALSTFYAPVTIYLSDFYSNTSNDDAGALYSYAGNLLVQNSKIRDNVADEEGGGITNDYGLLEIDSSTISGNEATKEEGGGIHAESLIMRNSLVTGNTSLNASDNDGDSGPDGNGGGLYLDYGGTIENSQITNNSSFDGGGIHLKYGTIAMTNTILSQNSATDYGGGIYIREGSLIARLCLISSNQAAENGGAIYNDQYAGVLLEDSVLLSNVADSDNDNSGDGGGYYGYDESSFDALRSTFSSNQAYRGGGVYLTGDSSANSQNSTFSANQASQEGGAFHIRGNGTLLIEFSSVINNSATGNGGGVYHNGDNVSIQNSIVAGNSANGSRSDSTADCDNTEPIVSGGYNIFGQSTGCPADAVFDQVITPATVFTALVDALADSGGVTLLDGSQAQTHALKSGSIAIDAAESLICPDTDQAGTARPQGNACDIGAFESSFTAAVTAPSSNVTILVDTTDDELNSDGDCSLREAIEAANTDSIVDQCDGGNGWDTINLPAGTYTTTLTGSENLNQTGDRDILTDSLTIKGVGSGQTIIDANDIERVFHIEGDVALFLESVTLTNGQESCVYADNGLHRLYDSVISSCENNRGLGGAIESDDGVLQIISSTLESNGSGSSSSFPFPFQGVGGAISIEGSPATLYDSVLRDNSALYGGAIAQRRSSIIVHDSDLNGNTVGDKGGGINCDGGSIIIDRQSTIESNSAAEGGALWADCLLAIDDSTFTRNSALSGGALSLDGDDGMWVRNSRFENNVAGEDGGGFYLDKGARIENSTIYSNTASDQGGAIYGYDGILDISETLIDKNSANYGGGIYGYYAKTVLRDSTVSNNESLSNQGGALYLGEGEEGGLLIERSTISSNKAASGQEGGAIYGYYAVINVISSTFSSNSTDHNGGAIYLYTSTLDIVNSTFSNNSANQGAAIYNHNGGAALNFSTLANNSSTADGGAIYQGNTVSNTTVLENSIVAGNSANSSTTDGAADCHQGKPITSGGYNLFGSSTGCSSNGVNDESVDPASVFVSVLGPLANNGGNTETHALLVGSPALDKIPSGSNSCATMVTIDQRGVSRPQNQACDIGAYEALYVDFELTKSVSNVNPIPGEEIIFTITITNNGTLSGTNALISDTLPTGLNFVGPITLSPSTVGTVGDANSLPTLASSVTVSPSTQLTLTFPVSVSLGLAGGTQITNTVGVTSSEVTAFVTDSVGITVTNVAPIAVDDTYSTTENISLTISAPGVLDNDRDINNDSLTSTLEVAPMSGTIALASDGLFVYTPTQNFSGEDYFSYISSDGTLTDTAQVTITIVAPEIDVLGNSTSIANGSTTPNSNDHTDFGSADVFSGTVSRSFTMQNLGTSDLTLNGSPKVLITGTNASDFTVTTQPASPVTSGGGVETFVVEFDPRGRGTRTATISIDNNDSDENPYTFTIQGTGTVPAANQPPELDQPIPDITVVEGAADQLLNLLAYFSDPENDLLFFTVINNSNKEVLPNVLVGQRLSDWLTLQFGTPGQTELIIQAEEDVHHKTYQDRFIVTVLERPSISISKSASNSTVSAGESITYTIAITNNGPSTATNALIRDILPNEMTFTSGSIRATGIQTGTLGSTPSTLASAVTLLPSQAISLTFAATVNQDVLANQTITNTVQLTSTEVITAARATHVINIRPPELTISDVTVSEGSDTSRQSAEQAPASFRVTLDRASALPVTVNFTTVDVSATSEDYSAISGTLTIPSGEREGLITVQITDDNQDEGDETFIMQLSNPVNTTIIDGQAIATITDNDETATTVTLTNLSAQRSSGAWQISILLLLFGLVSEWLLVKRRMARR